MRNFTAGNKAQIFVFDKSADRQFRTHVKNVAAESGFHDFTHDGVEYTIEPSLAEIEGRAAEVFRSICENQSIGHLEEETRQFLSRYLALQLTRTRQAREVKSGMVESTRELLQSRGDDPSRLDELRDFSDNEESLSAIRQMHSSGEYAPYFLVKKWALLKANRRYPFYLGDHPIALHNSRDFGPYGNIGLAVPGIEIYFPISRSYTLAMWCPTIETVMGELEAGNAVSCQPDNITFMNSLQVRTAERFVYSYDGNFDLVKRMLTEHPEYRNGPRITVCCTNNRPARCQAGLNVGSRPTSAPP